MRVKIQLNRIICPTNINKSIYTAAFKVIKNYGNRMLWTKVHLNLQFIHIDRKTMLSKINNCNNVNSLILNVYKFRSPLFLTMISSLIFITIRTGVNGADSHNGHLQTLSVFGYFCYQLTYHGIDLYTSTWDTFILYEGTYPLHIIFLIRIFCDTERSWLEIIKRKRRCR